MLPITNPVKDKLRLNTFAKGRTAAGCENVKGMPKDSCGCADVQICCYANAKDIARLLSLQTKPGQLRVAFSADIIAVKGNPLVDITLLQHVDFVMKGGKFYKTPGQ